MKIWHRDAAREVIEALRSREGFEVFDEIDDEIMEEIVTELSLIIEKEGK